MAAPASVILHGPWGGQGGDRYEFQTSNGIAMIIMQVDGNVKSVYFRDSSRYTSGVLGGTGQDLTDLGKRMTVDIKWPYEQLKSISGTFGPYKGVRVITSLTFTTNLHTYGPFGTACGTVFCHPVIRPDHSIVGVHGKFGFYLDSIGTFVAPMVEKPAVSVGLVGGKGGSPWTYIVTDKGIKKITVNFGQNVKSLTFVDSTDKSSGKIGGSNKDDPGKAEEVEITFPSEYLTSITGAYGNFAGMTTITSISFITNKKTSGPFGMRGQLDKPFSFSSTKIVGLYGKAGHYIDSIGLLTKGT